LRKKRVGYTAILVLCICLLVPVGNSQAKDLSVKVTLPRFAVKLNGHVVENQYRKYPLLVYRNITYFPMTWYDSRLLGLEANWSRNNGLNIKQSHVTSTYVSYHSESRNATNYVAKAPASVITINGKKIDNTKEKYPLLSFRNVTYFPLTWRFAHDEFGWDYQWNSANGLSITSQNPQVQIISLPKYAGKNDVALYKGYYYFTETIGTSNHVFRAPIQDPSDKKEIYTYNFGTTDRMPSAVSFQIRDNNLWFTYHLGGGFTGEDVFVKIGEDGKAELQHQGYLNFRETSYGTIIIHQGASAFEGGNLYLLPPGEEEANSKKIGDPNLKYAVTFDGTWALGPGGNASYIGVSGENVYVLASKDVSDANKIYKINLDTNKTEKIVNSSVNMFRVFGNKLYYVKDEDNTLYSSALDGSGEMKLSDHAVSWFDSIDGNIFYTTKKQTNQFELYQVNLNGDDPLEWKTPVTDVKVLNNRLVLQFGKNDGVVLLDGSGSLQVKVANPISRIFTSDKGVLLESSKDSRVEFIQ
jgi:hypothetical protein